MTVTILGGSGFIGSHLVRRLRQLGVEHEAPGREVDLRGRALDVVVYCIGLTADFRTRPLETVDAHVSRLTALVASVTCTSLTYLSSTRVYRRCPSPATEDQLVPVASDDPDDLYDLSKLTGEAVALATGVGRVVRLSNVYGIDISSPNFLSSVIRDSVVDGEIVLRTSPESWKDYVGIDDAVDIIWRVASTGTRPLYNVASGTNVSHRQLTDSLAGLTGCGVRFEAGSPTLQPPQLSIRRIQDEFGFRPTSLLEQLPALVTSYRAAATSVSSRAVP